MPLSQEIVTKFKAEGLAQVNKEAQRAKRTYVDWLEAADQTIQELNAQAEEFADDQEKLAQLNKKREKAARDANRAIAASYRELGVRSTESIEDAKDRAIAAYEAIEASGKASSRDLEIASARLEAKLRDLDGQLGEVEESAVDAGAGFDVAKIAVGGFIANLATDALRGFVGGLQNFIGGSVRTRAELTRLRDQLELLEGDEAAGEAAFQRISEFAKTTPFEINEVTQAYVKLGNRGIKPTNDQLIALGDLALSQNKSLDQLVEAVLDAQTGENERLKEFGIRGSKSGDQVTFAFKGVEKQVALTEDAVLDALVSFGQVEGVAGSIEKAGDRLDGVGSNIADSFTRLQDTLGGIFEPILVQLGKGLVDILGPISDPEIFAPLQDAFIEIVEAAQAVFPSVEGVSSLVEGGLKTGIELIADIIRQLAGVIRNSKDELVAVGQTVAQLAAGGFRSLLELAQNFVTTLAQNPGIIGEILGKVGGLIQALGAVSQLFLTAANAVISIIAVLAQVNEATGGWLGNILLAVGAIKVVVGVVGAIAAGIGAITAAWAAVSAAIVPVIGIITGIASVIAAVVAAVGAIPLAFVAAGVAIFVFRDKIAEVAIAVKDLFFESIASIPDAFSNAVGGIEALWTQFTSGAQDVFQNFIDVSAQNMSLLGEAISPVTDFIRAEFDNLLVDLQAFWTSVGGFALDVLAEIFGGTENLQAAWDVVSSAAIFIWENIRDYATGVVAFLSGDIEGLTQAWNAVRDLAIAGWEVITQAGEASIATITSLWGDLGEFVQDIWNRIRQVAQDVIDSILSALQPVFQWWGDLQQKAGDTWNSVRDVATDAIGKIIDPLDNLLKPFDKIKEIGGDIGKSIIGWADPLNAATGILDKFKNGFAKILGLSKNVGTDSGRALEETVGSGGPLLPAPGNSFAPSKFPVTSPFGPRGNRFHFGTDYGTPQGTPLANIFGSGTVSIASYGVGGYGGLIELILDNGDIYRFGHISQFNVRAGQRVPAGALMGLTGGQPGTQGAGRSSGPHLHLEYYPGGGGAVNFEATGKGGPEVAMSAVKKLGANSSELRDRLAGAQVVSTSEGTRLDLSDPVRREDGQLPDAIGKVIKQSMTSSGKGGPEVKVKKKSKKKKKKEPQRIKIEVGGETQTIEIVETKNIERFEVEKEVKDARKALDDALKAFAETEQTEQEQLESQIKSKYERILDDLNLAVEKYELLIKVKKELKIETDAEEAGLEEAIDARERAIAAQDKEIAKIGEVIALQENLALTQRASELRGIDDDVILGRAQNELARGEITPLELERLQIERRELSVTGEFASRQAQLQIDLAQATVPEQIEHIEELIEKYDELKAVRLDELKIELDDVNRRQREARSLLPSAEDFTNSIVGELRRIPDLLGDVVNGTVSLGNALRQFFSGLLQSLSNLFLDRAFDLLSGALGGLLGGGGGGFLGGLFGGGGGGGGAGAAVGLAPSGIFAASEGAVLRGFGGGDRRPFLLEDGEAVIRKEAVRMIGPETLAQVNQNPSDSLDILSPAVLMSEEILSGLRTVNAPALSSSITNNNSRTQNINMIINTPDADSFRRTQRQTSNQVSQNLSSFNGRAR